MTTLKQSSKRDLRGNRPYNPPNDIIELQLVDLQETHQLEKPRGYQVLAFGIDRNSNSYCVKINGYKPFYYILIDNKLTFKEFKENLIKIQIPNRFGPDKNVGKMLYNSKTRKHMIEEVYYKIFDGYYPEKSRFAKVSFNTLWDYKALQYYFKTNKYFIINNKNYKVQLAESNIPPMLRFLHEKNIQSAGWIEIKKGKYTVVGKPAQYSNCQYEVEANWKDINPSSEMNIGKLLIASFDIETTTDTGGFPLFTNPKDNIVQVATTVEMYGNPDWSYRYIATLGECDDIENCEVVKCETEMELLMEWSKFIRTLDPDIITGYNILGYDYEYLYERAKFYGIHKEFSTISRIRNLLKGNESDEKAEKIIYEVQKLSSSAMGENVLKSLNVQGRINLDLLKYCRDSGDKLASYKLDNVAKHYGLDNGKNDMPYHEIFRIFSSGNGTSAEKKRVAEYCVQDCKLCNQLVNKLNVIPNCIGMASTCYVPLQFLYSRGQGIKSYSLLVKEVADLGYVVPVKDEKDPGGYKGATVLSARRGAHFYPVTALDFASLYPSCMISHNICISTKITEQQIKEYNLHETDYRKVQWDEEMSGEDIIKIMAKSERHCIEVLENNQDIKDICHNWKYVKDVVYNSNPLKEQVRQLLIKKATKKDEAFFKIFGINIEDICISNFIDEKKEKEYVGVNWTKRHYYIQPKMKDDGELEDEERGVLPKILQKLLDKRNATKKLKAKYKKTDPFLSDIYDGLQLAYKITANSVYGQLGAPTGKFVNVGVAASVTTTGRQMLEIAENFIKKNYKAKPIYGDTDSVFMKYQLRDHSCDCPNHDNNRKQRIEEFYKIANEARNKMIKEKIPFMHTRQATTMLNHDYEIWVNCNCPEYDPMSEEALAESVKLGAESDAITTYLLPDRKRIRDGQKVGVQQLEYEKTYQPYILFSKKRYVGKLYEFNTTQENQYDEQGNLTKKQGWYLDYKGIVLKRRDNCGILKKIYKGCLMKIMDGETDEAFDFLNDSLKVLLNNHKLKKYPIEDFTITKTLKSYDSYKPDKHGNISQAHVMLAKRVEKRDPGNAFQTNERVPYCFIEIKGSQKGLLQGDLIETPQYITQENLKLDYLYYIKKQLQTPIEQLFEYIDHNRVKKIFQRHITRGENMKKGLKDISSFFKKNKTPKKILEKKKIETQELTDYLFIEEEQISETKNKEKKIKIQKKGKKSKKIKKVEENIEDGIDEDVLDLMDKCLLFDENPKKKSKKTKKNKIVKKIKKVEENIEDGIDEDVFNLMSECLLFDEKPKKKSKKVHKVSQATDKKETPKKKIIKKVIKKVIKKKVIKKIIKKKD
jgi:DNA polymerase elongation subunit (family B)